ncbi:MAG: PqqD family protein [Deltaproteobacteria bacterium]|nr:PqqD family protein [Deltaproteobacteria bacterium]
MEVTAASVAGRAEYTLKRQLVVDALELIGAASPPASGLRRMGDDALHRLAEQELSRRGGFERLYPGADTSSYLPLFPVPRRADVALLSSVEPGRTIERPILRPRNTSYFVLDGSLVLFSEESGRFAVLNESASVIWLSCVDGLAPDEIIGEPAHADAARGLRVKSRCGCDRRVRRDSGRAGCIAGAERWAWSSALGWDRRRTLAADVGGFSLGRPHMQKVRGSSPRATI